MWISVIWLIGLFPIVYVWITMMIMNRLWLRKQYHITSALTCTHPLDNSKQQDIEGIPVRHSASDVTQIPSVDNQILQFTPYISPGIQTSEETRKQLTSVLLLPLTSCHRPA